MPVGSAASQMLRAEGDSTKKKVPVDTVALKKRMDQDKTEIKTNNYMLQTAGPQETKYRKDANKDASDRLEARNDTLQLARKKKP